jgi:hypothetical protein
MPLFRIDGQNVLFIHVPKTGGTSIGHALGPYNVGLIYPHAPKQFSPVSPQHYHAEFLNLLFREGAFDLVFMLVRHPIERLKSEFRFRKHLMGEVQQDADFNSWIEQLLDHYKYDTTVSDNHIRPQVEFECLGARVFRIEDGMLPVCRFLNTHFSREVLVNVERHHATTREDVFVSLDNLLRLRDFYREDFQRYGYA